MCHSVLVFLRTGVQCQYGSIYKCLDIRQHYNYIFQFAFLQMIYILSSLRYHIMYSKLNSKDSNKSALNVKVYNITLDQEMQ